MMSGFNRSIATMLTLKMALRVTLVVTLVSLFSYWHILKTLELETSDKLSKYIVERGQKDSVFFQLAEQNQQLLKDSLLQAWKNQQQDNDNQKPQLRFEQLFDSIDDGTLRLSTDAYNGINRIDGTVSEYITAFVGINAPQTQGDFQNKLLLSYDLIDRFSDGWLSQFANLYISMPENVNIVYWPGLPWGLNAEAALDINTEEWANIANESNNPLRDTVWTGLYYDPTANEWMVSCETPVDYSGKHQLTIGTDILLNALFLRVFDDHLNGAYNFIFRQDGRLIAHPDKQKELIAAKGLLNITDLHDSQLSNMAKRALDANQQHVIYDEAHKVFIAVTKIEGPDWVFVTVYPTQLLASSALKAAEIIAIIGFLSLIIELLLLYQIIRMQVVRPLKQFVVLANQVIKSKYNASTMHLPVQRSDEMGLFARAFTGMCNKVVEEQSKLEIRVDERTKELAQSIQQLQLTEKDLQQSLVEKELLLKEVHHRVKNNMQVISSLLSLQTRKADTPELKKALQESQQRVKTMASVHEQLYLSDNLEDVDAIKLITEVCHDVFRVQRQDSKQINLELQLDEIVLNLDQAIPLGLIINELITNTMKYAFPVKNSGNIYVIFTQIADGQLLFTYKDDGVGLAENLDWKTLDTLGMKLIIALSDQLHADINFESDSGLVFTMLVKV